MPRGSRRPNSDRVASPSGRAGPVTEARPPCSLRCAWRACAPRRHPLGLASCGARPGQSRWHPRGEAARRRLRPTGVLRRSREAVRWPISVGHSAQVGGGEGRSIKRALRATRHRSRQADLRARPPPSADRHRRGRAPRAGRSDHRADRRRSAPDGLASTSRSRRTPDSATRSSGPPGARHRVVDIDHSADVTEAFTDRSGPRRAAPRRHRLRATPAASCASRPTTSATRSQRDHYVASAGPRRPAPTVGRGRQGARTVNVAWPRPPQETGSDAEDAVAFAEIERRHQDFERAQEDSERVRYLSFITGAGGALVGIAAAAIYGFCWARAVPAAGRRRHGRLGHLLAAPGEGPQGRGGGPRRRRCASYLDLPDPPGQRPASATTTPAER